MTTPKIENDMKRNKFCMDDSSFHHISSHLPQNYSELFTHLSFLLEIFLFLIRFHTFCCCCFSLSFLFILIYRSYCFYSVFSHRLRPVTITLSTDQMYIIAPLTSISQSFRVLDGRIWESIRFIWPYLLQPHRSVHY